MAPSAAPITPTKADVTEQLAALAAQNAELTKSVAAAVEISRTNNEMLSKAAQPNYANGNTPANLFNGGKAPHARTGEDPMSSRPYSFYKALGSVRRDPFVTREDAKIEYDLSGRLHRVYNQSNGYTKAVSDSMMVPFSADLIACQDEALGAEIKAMVKSGPPTDVGEVAFLLKKFGYEKTLSWLDESLGGTLVPPPQQMELIELLRNNAAITVAGASIINMPPNGRAIWPRQTAPGQFYWVGEGSAITDSSQATGDLTLSAKKAAALTKVNNELFRFAGINVEQFVKNDLAKVLGLGIDKAAMDGAGSDKSIKGLINYANVQSYSASSTGANGDALLPEDIYLMISKVFGKNANFTGWICRPELWGLLQSYRASAIQPGDNGGNFVWGLLRVAQEGVGIGRGAIWQLGGYQLTQSTNVSQTRQKGTASNLTMLLGGDWPDYKLAMSGVVEIAMNTQGDTAFQNDQTWVRAINFCDSAPAHEASFIKCDDLLMVKQ